ncbi:MAG TPA: TIGR03118 family protein [Caulobacteraceae bacterium]|jgi:uncharacterized protein (TIGR03118 family)
MMTTLPPLKFIITGVVAAGALSAGATLAQAGEFAQTNLVSDVNGLAPVIDPDLKNPWGVSFIPGVTPFWVSNQATNTTTLYAATGFTSVSKFAQLPLVAIPTTGAGPQGPTGQVSNANPSSFIMSDGSPAFFIFANLNGQISAWNLGVKPLTSAVVEWTTPGALYTGLAVNQAHTMLYAANNATGAIDVFNSSFAPTLPGTFATPTSISSLGLTPFNVQDLGGNIYVTYAPLTHALQTTATAGKGAVAEFSETGAFEKVVIPGGPGGVLASPWGITLAPASFGEYGGDLLVGNFSFADSGIHAFDPTTGAPVGTIPIDVGAGNTPGGLWTLTFGGGDGDGNPNVLFFTDGINGEKDGLFGAITSVPEPSTWLMMLTGLGALGLAARLRRSRERALA